MSSTGGGQHHGLNLNEGQPNETYVDLNTHQIRQMIQAIRYIKPDLYASIANALGDPIP